ncbi:MAG: primosomal protein N' [Chlamydiales bacterium]
MTDHRYVSVILERGFEQPLDYQLPKEIEKVYPGERVKIPIQNRTAWGYVVAVKETSSFAKIRSILQIDSSGSLPSDLFALATWMSNYYGCSLQRSLRCTVPAMIRKQTQAKEQWFVSRNQTYEEMREHCKEIRTQHPAQAAILDVILLNPQGLLMTELLEKAQVSKSPLDSLVKQKWLHLAKVRIDRSPLIGEDYFKTKPKVLTDEQTVTHKAILKSVNSNLFNVHLIHGVTGSGKTEIYLQIIQEVLTKGRSALMMVPEIALTTQMIERFRSRFEDSIAVLHHRLSDGERYDQWQKIQRGEVRIVLGARSAVFSPLKNLGIIIVDEEHEASYKQSEESPCYHARDLAVMRGKLNSCPVILGSATPSFESYNNALQGKYLLHTLHRRSRGGAVPHIKIIDMKHEDEKQKHFTLYSEALLNGIEKRAKKGEQSIVFLNRRGYHTLLSCLECEYQVKCRQCEAALTFYRKENCLLCHLCGERYHDIPLICPQCTHRPRLSYKGIGTEQVERTLRAILPEVRTIRLDADTTRHKGSHQQLLRDFGTGKADVLIGTQMVAKGLHFPEVTLVGILNCDTALSIPDFRSTETAFQLMTQVAGRSGRGEILGEVILQTRIPQHPLFSCVRKGDFAAFYHEEISSREMFAFPPFSRLAKLQFSGTNEENVFLEAERMRNYLISQLSDAYQLMPVIPPGHPKIKDKYRFHFIVKGTNMYRLSQCIKSWKPSKTVKLLVDIDPVSIFF